MELQLSALALVALSFAHRLGTAVAYSEALLPSSLFTPTLHLQSATAAHSPIRSLGSTVSTTTHDETLYMKSVFQRVFRRGRNRVQTLERETTPAPPGTQQKKEPEQRWRVMFHNTEYMPDRVARVLARIIPTLDRRAAFEICSRARMMGKVAVLVTNKKEAEMYCLLLQRQGLTATVEPHIDPK